jgi:2-phosphoxylose phosphatase
MTKLESLILLNFKIHRHHKRTPYQSNTFPVESSIWNCDDEGLFYYGQPAAGNRSADTYWQGFLSSQNPFVPTGYRGSCQFPQITKGGLDDSWQHGKDLFGVYHDLLGFLPTHPGNQVTFRVTSNVITSQVAGMLINGMFGITSDIPLLKEATSVESLEPAYICTPASTLFSTEQSAASPSWAAHLTASQPLYDKLDAISGVSPSDSGFHMSWDHYYDNLSSRLCHARPLPCNVSNPTLCVTQNEANEVFRLGQWEYSYTYRDNKNSLQASTGSYGVWVAQLAQNIRDRIANKNPVIYRHNVAHDGSISRLLSILQLEKMVWPGMGSEVAFEVYKKKSSGKYTYFLRVLWGGKIFRSSNPTLGIIDMVPLDRVLAYFDGLVGVGASEVATYCNGS